MNIEKLKEIALRAHQLKRQKVEGIPSPGTTAANSENSDEGDIDIPETPHHAGDQVVTGSGDGAILNRAAPEEY